MLVDAFLLMDDLEFAPEVDTAPGVLPREGSHGLVRSRTTSAVKPDYLERFFGELPLLETRLLVPGGVVFVGQREVSRVRVSLRAIHIDLTRWEQSTTRGGTWPHR